VRAHTSVRTKSGGDWRWSAKWPEHCLIFDTETTLDAAQKLNFGTYRRCVLVDGEYRCLQEGIFYRDDVTVSQLKVLEKYRANPRTVPAIEVFPAINLKLMAQSAFISHVFWKAVRSGELVLGYNLPFDLSRLATLATKGKKGEWSLALSSLWKNPKTGRVVPNPKWPRIVIDAQNSKMAFIRLGSILHKEQWKKEGRFLDLRTLGWALRSESYSLKSACKGFGVKGKVEHKPSGRITPQEIDYCRGDVAATHRLLNAMMAEFNQNPIDLKPDKAYSPASIAKAYLQEMGIKKPKGHFEIAAKSHGIAMQSYYGGRAECRIRKTPVPVIHTDFTSQYPTVNALLGNWNVLTSSSVKFVDATTQVRRLLLNIRLKETFEPSFWGQLSFFGLIKPHDDVVPVRTVYPENTKTQNIGVNFLRSDKPIWYAGPDLVASVLLTGRVPKLIKALRVVPHGRQSALNRTNLRGMVEINPAKDDFYREVIKQRVAHKSENKALAHFLKILANSGSYGLFVEVNKEMKSKPTKVRYFSGEKKGTLESTYREKPGAWYFPPLASLITAGGRLLLAMLEKSVVGRGASYLFCDTDSLCIVGSKNGGFVPCAGGSHTHKGQPAIKALSLDDVKSIADEFNKLNPYRSTLVPDILKIEDVNFAKSKPRNPFRQIFGYAISAKRYALFTKSGKDIHIEKASGHGLGYLYSPKESRSEESEGEEAPAWVKEAWDFLVRKELGLRPKEPSWLHLPAMMRMVVTTPNVLKNQRPEWLGPFNFFLYPLLSPLGGYPTGCDKTNFFFIAPMESDRSKWSSLSGINIHDGKMYRVAPSRNGKPDRVVPDSFRIILRQYLDKSEVKSLAPDGTPCTSTTHGLLRKARITAGKLIPVGKETDRHWEQGEDPSMIDPSIHIYEKPGNMCIAELFDRKRWSKLGVRRLMRASGLSQTTVYKILRGEPVRRYVLANFRQAVDRTSV
jgi:hypothetical protein